MSDKVDTSFEIPSFGFPSSSSSDSSEKSEEEKTLLEYLSIIDDYDKKIDTLSKENTKLKFDNNRMKLAFDLISSYISSLK